MARQCMFSKKGRQCGHRVSHANNRTKHVFQPNLQRKRLYAAWLGRMVTVKVSTQMLRSIDKLGLEQACKKFNVTL
jgi:large subunit ribosomal protein L28